MLVTRSMQLQKSALIPRTRIRKSIDLSASFCEAIKSAQEKGDRSSGVAEFRSGSPVRLDCACIGNKELGDLFQKMLHLCCGAITQVLSQDQIVSAFFEGALCDIEKTRFVARTTLSESFCDVCRNGNCRATHLVRKAIDLTSGKICRKRIGRQDESMGF